MTLIRPVLAVALGASLVIAGTADAKAKPKPPKPVCNLVTDKTGDANQLPLVGTVGVGPADPSYDITSVDVASDGKKFTGAVRVVKLSKTAAVSPSGIHWNADFTIGDSQYFLSAAAVATGDKGAELDVVTNPTTGSYKRLSSADAVFDLAKNEVRITAKITDFSEKVVSGKTVITGLGGSAGREYYAPGVVTGQDYTDVATSDSTYKAGAPSCVTPGK